MASQGDNNPSGHWSTPCCDPKTEKIKMLQQIPGTTTDVSVHKNAIIGAANCTKLSCSLVSSVEEQRLK